jgi:hypothetical protein
VSVRIVILVEGRTEKAFRPTLQRFLEQRLPGRMPKLHFDAQYGPLPRDDRLKKVVADWLARGSQKAEHVIALTDVYTGRRDFEDGEDARRKLRAWVGDEPRFHPHAAQYEFEAWLLPFWDRIQQLAKHNRAAPSGPPENVNHDNPPSRRIAEAFRAGKARDTYVKVRDAARILEGCDLADAARVCPHLRDFLNTILTLSGGEPLS